MSKKLVVGFYRKWQKDNVSFTCRNACQLHVPDQVFAEVKAALMQPVR